MLPEISEKMKNEILKGNRAISRKIRAKLNIKIIFIYIHVNPFTSPKNRTSDSDLKSRRQDEHIPGVGASGTHRNFQNLGTAGYRVPGKFEKLGTAGYRVPGYRPIPIKFRKIVGGA